MIVLAEHEIAELVTPRDAFAAVERVFAAMAQGEARNFPVVREALGHGDALYGFKGGFGRGGGEGGPVLGLKAGGYFPANGARGIPNHQSTVFLFDPDTGQCRAAVGGNLLTALRTAAAAAVSVAHLARADARVLGLVGAGHQAPFQLRAVAAQRPFARVLAWNRTPERLGALAEAAAELGLPFEAAPLERVAAEADVIVTITSSFAPVLPGAGVRPGTHLACMGTDTRGKQEVEPALLARAALFTDEVAQALTIGECQHAVALGLGGDDVVPLGAVIAGTHPGRRSDEEITLFDGTGVGLQDLAVAAAAVERSQARPAPRAG